MYTHRVTDWNDAYANAPNIPGGERWPQLWAAPAAAWREEMTAAGRAELNIAYGGAERQRLDLFMPASGPRGLMVFVHGGFWKALDKSYWSHLARGAVESGYAVAMPSYTLCPASRIAGITSEIALAVEAASDRVPGEIRLTGHSAGGHLVTRMICSDAPLSAKVRERIVNTVSISGVHDLRPLIKTEMNDILGIDATEAAAESPALLEPVAGARLTCWVGAAERSEFLRQSALLANVWTGLGAATSFVAEPDRHHFDVIDGLADPGHALVRALLQ